MSIPTTPPGDDNNELSTTGMTHHDEEAGYSEDPVILWFGVSVVSGLLVRRTSRPNNYLMDDYLLHPPSPLEDIDVVVWQRFTGRLQVANASSECDWWTFFLCVVAFGLMIAGAIGVDNHVETRWQNSSLFVVSVLAFCGIFLWCARQEEANISKAREKVLSKMKQTFAYQGYSLSMIKEKSCVTCPEYAVGIQRCQTTSATPNEQGPPTLDQHGGEDVNSCEEDDSEAADFDPEAWLPLEGHWRFRRFSNHDPSTRCYCWKVSFSIIEVTGTSGEETLTILQRDRVKHCYGLCVQDSESSGRALGNTVVMGDLEHQTDVERDELISRNRDEREKARQEQVWEWERLEKTFYPVGMGQSEAYYYRNKSRGNVWKVQGDILITFVDLEDEWISDADILSGALEDRQQTDGEDGKLDGAEFEKIGNDQQQ